MSDLVLTRPPAAKTGMLIRRPVAEVFEAFVNPAITEKFWFTKGSARFEEGREVVWTWEMYGMSITVTVKAVEPNRRILVEWPAYGSPSRIEWTLTDRGDGTTFVSFGARATSYQASKEGRIGSRQWSGQDTVISSMDFYRKWPDALRLAHP